ncbi:hypothetical protein M885DRAFT_545370 [Pelagophyceae sp. CCMP2097]|nr:hypothetical protein M885DRAFT_545370 [Pelagophyceae sp. CCMP2097]|mmetsp:Transcript_30870/g.103968  ORF Transcript_30870/g.103968 Transcript_30870/m.103968 type:complete len:219 (-) Transcript_30870:75-731(-)
MIELSESLPEGYEKQMLSASMDCGSGTSKLEKEACHNVGEFFAVIRRDYVSARDTYKTNCDDRKYGASCFNLARLLLGGKGGDVDDKGAFKRFKQGCDLGHTPACHHFGLLNLKNGDIKTGVKNLKLACDNGDQASCYLVGMHHLRTTKVSKRNPLQGLKHLTLACDDGHAPACHNLAVMFKKGDEGIPADAAQFEKYSTRTRELVQQRGQVQGITVA